MSTAPSGPGEEGPAAPTEDFHGPAFDVFQRRCPSRTALEHVTTKWAVLVLTALSEGEARFGALRRRVDGVSEKMLAQTLHTLERDGLVVRTVRRPIPPHVEYALTPLGADTARALLGLVGFLEGRTHEITAARGAYDAAHPAGG